ncbi:hypothetical protein D3C85_997460 [compost metagenome]
MLSTYCFVAACIGSVGSLKRVTSPLVKLTELLRIVVPLTIRFFPTVTLFEVVTLPVS